MGTTRGFGLAGESPLEAILAAAPTAEGLGYHSFWLSQPREGSTLATLRRVADATDQIRVGVGAIPLTAMTADEIAHSVSELGLPPGRLRLGVGSGTGAGALERLRSGVARLRVLLDTEIVIAPLGPKMCTVAGELADTALLNWLTPQHAEVSAAWVRAGAWSVNRATPTLATYVRCAVGNAPLPRLEAECARYGSFPHYAAHFARQGVRPIETTIHASDEQELQDRLARYEAVLDHVVVRAITPSGTPSEIIHLIEAAKPVA